MTTTPSSLIASLRARWRPWRRWQRWWQGLSPAHQDRMVSIVPLISVLLFLAAIASAFTYFTRLEAQREQQEVTRDVEYAQQRLRLRLLEPHEPLQRMAAEVVGGELSPQLFGLEAELLAGRFPELLALTWLDARDQVVSAHAAVQAPALLNRSAGQPVLDVDTEGALGVARTTLQPHFSRPLGGPGPDSRLLLLLPLTHFGSFQGTLMVEYSLEMLLRLGVPGDVRTRYALALVDLNGNVVAEIGRAHV